MWTIAACAALVAGTAPGAFASAHPAKPLLVMPATGRVGSAALDRPALAIIDAWGGPADLTATIPHLRSSMMVWTVGKVAWAVATFDDPAQEHASGLFFRGPFRTLRTDHIGTPLALVLKHWPHHSQPRPSTTMPGFVTVTIARMRFLFDRSKRLAAVATGTEVATELAQR